MKALTLWEPWATLWLHGAKVFETRSWRTNYTGPLAVHAGRHWTDELAALCHQDPYRSALLEILGGDSPLPRHRGCVLGEVQLAGCHTIDARFRTTVGQAHGPQELDFGNWETGRVAWEATGPREILEQPLPWSGERGVWELPRDWRTLAEEAQEA